VLFCLIWEGLSCLFSFVGFVVDAFFFSLVCSELFPRSLVRRAGLRGGEEEEGVGGLPVGWSDKLWG